MKKKTLTRSEMQVMNALWQMDRDGTVADILTFYDEPRPAYTTVSTFLKILINKGFVASCRRTGQKALLYRPLLTREQYTERVMADVKENLFDGSATNFFSFFIRRERLSKEEIDEILRMIC